MNAAASEIRRGTAADIEFGIEMVRARYPTRDIRETKQWIEWLLANENRLVLIGSRTVGCAQFFWRYGIEPRARLEFLAAKPSSRDALLEPLRMVRMMVDWAKAKGAKGQFSLSADDSNIDFGPFAQRLGGEERVLKYWTIPLE